VGQDVLPAEARVVMDEVVGELAHDVVLQAESVLGVFRLVKERPRGLKIQDPSTAVFSRLTTK
jgi:hypothetical protein